MHLLPAGRLVGALIVSFMLTGCGGGGSSGGPSQPAPSPDYQSLTVVDPASPYRDVLEDCVLIASNADSCLLGLLPVLGQDTASPTVNDVMARAIVSHAWMGTRLRQLLERMPSHMLGLMRPVTAVVIAADVRPSFYSGSTAAIYIDPAYLWLSNDEKLTVSTEPDYRAEFGVTLPFVSLSRYVEGSRYAWESFSLSGSETRTIADIDRRVASVLLHELAHANDALPLVELPFLDSTMTAYEAIASLSGRFVSDQLSAMQPLNSQLLMDLGDVLFRGVNPTPEQLALTAQQVGLEFETDGANDDYAYSTIREDLAMLFEEVMMNYYYGIDREIAYTNAPSGDDRRYCDSYFVRWGFRSRIGDPLVRARAEMALQLLLDQADVSEYIANLPAPQRMTNGVDWCSVRTSAEAAQTLSVRPGSSSDAADQDRKLIPPEDLSLRD